MALAQKQTHRPLELNKRPRNDPTQIEQSDFSQRYQIIIGKETDPLVNGAVL
jgi:hypothetical protein